jgi:hypothetical protein
MALGDDRISTGKLTLDRQGDALNATGDPSLKGRL